MQNFNFVFVENEFWPTGVYVLSSISITLHNFCPRFFSMYRGVIKLKNDTSILPKNGSFAKKTCCSLIVLFVKTKIYFFCCNNFANKQMSKSSSYFFLYRLWEIGRTQNIPENFAILQIKP